MPPRPRPVVVFHPAHISTVEFQLNRAKRNINYVWMQYYNRVQREFDDNRRTLVTYQRLLESEMPPHTINVIRELYEESKTKWECAICRESISDLHITKCCHFFCSGCVEGVRQQAKQQEREYWPCPTCRNMHAIE